MRIVADLSLNFQGLDDILDTIKAVQCDYIKLQWYSEKDLYGTGSEATKLDPDWLPQINQACISANKRLLCTVFNPDKVRIIDPFVFIHKVASSEITDRDLLKQIVLCRKQIIVSTGGATKDQLMTAKGILHGLPIIWLACDVEYPAKRHNIRKMLQLKNIFPNDTVGYSDHSLDIESFPIICAHYNAGIYEKHVKPTLDHPSYEKHALTVVEFNEMVDAMAGKSPKFVRNPHQRVFDKVLNKWVRPRV
jgi:N-acetylneuraminate synthase